jgi:hypothetical protein
VGHTLVLASCTIARPFGVVARWLGIDSQAQYAGKQQNGLLNAVFGCGPNFLLGRALELSLPSLQRILFRQSFSPRRVITHQGHSYELFYESFFTINSHTWLSGWFQSEGYFAGNAERVREWFRPKPEDGQRANEIIAQWPTSPEGIVAVHIRRGDYDGLSDRNEGWLLTAKYYRTALDRSSRCESGYIF